MTENVSYLIRIQDHINKSIRIVNHITNLNTYTHDFNIIINSLNKDNIYTSASSNGQAELSRVENIVVPGYIYNSTKSVTTLVYTISLIKIDETLTNLFLSESSHAETQTNTTNDTSDIQTKETQSEQQTSNKDSQTQNDINELARQYENTKFYNDREDEAEFGDFQSYVPEFTNVDLNSCYPYCNNVIVPSYTPTHSYNPFTNIMSLRGENDDVHFTFGSQVPKAPTQVINNWKPELISELKFRLNQPNAGLLPTNSNVNYFL